MRACAWCKGPIPSSSRRDALTCSTRCRQARHRFTSTVGQASAVVHGHPRRLAYADPPYPGLSAKYYGDHPDFAGEVDHAELVASLSADYDAWALSTSAHALPAVLALCPPGVRVAAWFRGERAHTTAMTPLNAWEPVIYAGAIAIRRSSTPDASAAALHDASAGVERLVVAAGSTGRAGEDDTSRSDRRRVDALLHVSRPRTTDPRRVVGAKPAAFCRWIFDLLGAQAGDELVDVFPGSGGVARAWETFTTVERDATSGATSTWSPRRVAEDLHDGTLVLQ